MSRSKKWRLEWAFFLGENGRRQYNKVCLGCAHDCKNDQELWRQMEKRKRLNAAFSHDLRNPVTVLKGSVKMARQCADSGTERTAQLIENLTRIETYTGRIERYVEAMSSAGRLEQIQVEKALTDPQILARELENAIRLVVVDGGKQLSFTSTVTAGKILLDIFPLPIPDVSVNTRKGVVVNYAPCQIAI